MNIDSLFDAIKNAIHIYNNDKWFYKQEASLQALLFLEIKKQNEYVTTELQLSSINESIDIVIGEKISENKFQKTGIELKFSFHFTNENNRKMGKDEALNFFLDISKASYILRNVESVIKMYVVWVFDDYYVERLDNKIQPYFHLETLNTPDLNLLYTQTQDTNKKSATLKKFEKFGAFYKNFKIHKNNWNNRFHIRIIEILL